MKKIYVVGSGPSGVSLTKALIERGYFVNMIDVGKTLHKETDEQLMRLANKQFLSVQDKDFISGLSANRITVADEKKVFGSTYANKLNDFFKIKKNNTHIFLSFAKGGLSNLWGRLMMPLSREDASEWPFAANFLDQYYSKVLNFVPLSGRDDRLKKLFSLFNKNPLKMRLSSQADLLDKWLNQHVSHLEKEGFAFGQSRIAACFDGSSPTSGNCINCGMCLYGCVYNDLYTSSWTVDELSSHKNFNYQKGIIVDFIEEQNDLVKIHMRSDKDGKKSVIEADKVFIAAGTFASTRIVMKSKKMFNMAVKMKSSDFYIFPSFTFFHSKDVIKEKLNTCCQYFLQVDDKKIDSHIVNLQIYTYTDHYLKVLKKLTGMFYPLLKKPISWLLDRFIVVFCYLHSDNSGHMELTLLNDDVLNVIGRENPASKKIAKRLKFKLWRSSLKTGFFPFPFFLGKQKIGHSVHYGGTIPMNHSQELASDRHGKVKGFKNLHVVDSSIFPSIPSTSPTFVMMANAYRIGHEVKI